MEVVTTISSVSLWAEFFDRYYSNLNVSYRNEVETAIESEDVEKVPFSVDVLNSLVYFMEGKLYEELVRRPVRVIEHATKGLAKWIGVDGAIDKVAVRFYNMPQATYTLIKEIRPSNIGKMVTIEGIITKATFVYPRICRAVYECTRCGSRIEGVIEGEIIKPPFRCKCDGRKFDMVETEKISTQILTIQDFPENLKGGEIPRTIRAYLESDLTGKVVPGDRVRLVGIIEEIKSKRGAYDSAFLDYRVNANSLELLQKEYEAEEFTPEDLKKIKELSQRPDLKEVLIKSIAPSIHGMEREKLAITLALFGGVPKELNTGERKRGDIHILILGDPSVAKSELLRGAYLISPRAIYVSGKGVSEAGLTAAVAKDDFGKWTLEAGALVLADKGIALVDEFDKMSKEDRKSIHTALEQQIVTISKAGINATLMSRCTLIAAANPKYTRFDPYSPIADQIDLDPAILSRFDLIFIVRDIPDAQRDAELAKYVLGVHQNPIDIAPDIPTDLLRKYIAYARRNVKPKLSAEASDAIGNFYLSMRGRSKTDSPVSITVRQLEALVRLSEASARMRLSNVVTSEDAKLAIELMYDALKDVALDKETSEVDIDLVLGGVSKSKRDMIAAIREIVNDLDTGKGVHVNDILDEASARGYSREKVVEILAKMRQHGDVYCPKTDHYKLVKG